MTLKKGSSRITFIVVLTCILLFIILLILSLLNRNFDLKGIMGNSLVEGFYYCDDSAYTLKGNQCVKTNTSFPNILGDVNSDGQVDEVDSETLKNYLAKTNTLTEEQLVAADVNSDGIVSVGDAENIRLYATGHAAGSEYLSKIGTTKVCLKNYELQNNMCVENVKVDAKEAKYKRGDINLDGNVDTQDLKLLNKYLKKQVNLTTVQINVADFNSNNLVDINDLNEIEKYLNTENNDKKVSGDINIDGVINSNDIILLRKYLENEINLTNEQLGLSDIDSNGTIDKNDLVALAKKISEFYQIGDVNMNGTVDYVDLQMLQNSVNKVIVLDEAQLNLSDINEDGVIDNLDVSNLRNKISSIKKHKIGDVNMDGSVLADDVTIIENYILAKTTLTIDQMTLADYNKDDVIDNKDANNLAKAIAANYELGDVNTDGKVNFLDITLINKYICKTKELNTVQKILADVNKDGKVNANDLTKN